MWINNGTVAVTTGSATVTGTGTGWDDRYVIPGYAFLGPDGKLYEIGQVISATVFLLSKPYAGATNAAGTYDIIQMSYAASRNILEQIQTLLSTWAGSVNLTGTLKVGSPAEAAAVAAFKGSLVSVENAGSVALKLAKGLSTDTGLLQLFSGSLLKATLGLNASDVFEMSVYQGSTKVDVCSFDANGHLDVKRGVNVSSDGTPIGISNGSFWYDPALNKFRAVENGLTTNMIGMTGTSPTTVAWGLINGTIADQADLMSILNAKLDDSQATAFGLLLMGAASATGARTELGLGTAATSASTAFAAAVHTHTIAQTTGLQSALDAKAPLVSPALVMRAYSDFMNAPSTTPSHDDLGSFYAGTSSYVTHTRISKANPGVVRMGTGSTATGRAGLFNQPNFLILGGGEVWLEWLLQTVALSTPTERHSVICGMFTDVTMADQAHAVAFVYDEGGVSVGSSPSANWQTLTASASARTWNANPGTPTPVNTNFTKLGILVNAAGTRADFLVGGVNIGFHTTNIPIAISRSVGFGCGIIKSIGTASMQLNADYYDFTQKLTVAR